jgi:hypothetical protein
MLSGDREAPVVPAPFRHGRQCPRVSVLRCHLPHHILAVPRRSPHMSEAEEVECGPVGGRMAIAIRPLEPEVHKARLVRMEGESIPAETFAQRGECPLGGEVILERRHGIIRVSHQDAPPLEARTRRCLEPFVQHVVQVDVGVPSVVRLVVLCSSTPAFSPGWTIITSGYDFWKAQVNFIQTAFRGHIRSVSS